MTRWQTVGTSSNVTSGQTVICWQSRLPAERLALQNSPWKQSNGTVSDYRLRANSSYPRPSGINSTHSIQRVVFPLFIFCAHVCDQRSYDDVWCIADRLMRRLHRVSLSAKWVVWNCQVEWNHAVCRPWHLAVQVAVEMRPTTVAGNVFNVTFITHFPSLYHFPLPCKNRSRARHVTDIMNYTLEVMDEKACKQN